MRDRAHTTVAVRILSEIWKGWLLQGFHLLCFCFSAGVLISEPAAAAGPISVRIAGSTLYDTLGSATEALVTRDGFVLVSVSAGGGPGTGIQVFQPLGRSFVNPCSAGPRRIIRFPQPVPGQDVTSVQGIKFFPASTSLGIGAAVEGFGADFARITSLTGCAIDGVVNVPQREIITPPDCSEPFCSPGSFDIAFTPNGSNAFIANEYGQLPVTTGAPIIDIHGSGTIGVVKIDRDAVGRFTSRTRPIHDHPYLYVLGGGAIPGVTISNDGKWLFVTSENTSADRFRNPTGIAASNPNFPIQVNGNCNNAGARNGLLTIINVQMAISGQGQASIKRRIASGCEPVRVVQTANGKLIWVAVRGDNRVLAYDVQKLVSDQNQIANTALVGYANTGGTAPVGMALFHGDQLLAVANSNRFNAPGGVNNIAILDVTNPAAASVRAKVPSAFTSSGKSGFPRDVTVGNDGSTLFVPNTAARKLQVVTTAASP